MESLKLFNFAALIYHTKVVYNNTKPVPQTGYNRSTSSETNNFFLNPFFRTLKMKEEKTTNTCINLGSYNYLGFAENSGPVTEQAISACRQYGLATCSTRHEVNDSIV